MSKVHRRRPFRLTHDGTRYRRLRSPSLARFRSPACRPECRKRRVGTLPLDATYFTGRLPPYQPTCVAPPNQPPSPRQGAARGGYVDGALLRSWATAVTSCAGANGLLSMMLFGTPLDAQSSACAPLM